MNEELALLIEDMKSDGRSVEEITAFIEKYEAEKEAEDYYYNFLKEKGWFDFVEDFVQPEWKVEGVRIDTELNYPMTIQAPYIR